jgi:uncharacterized membrane protein HdeD (DUF308 family)
MSQVTPMDGGAFLGRLGQAWGWILAYGIISLLIGLAAIFFPGATLLAIAILFGAQLVVGGVFQFAGAFAVPVESGWLRALTAGMAALSVIVGIYCLRHPFFSILILAVILGLFWIVAGVVQLFVGIGHPELSGRGFVVAGGILSIIAGAIVLFFPGISLVALALVLGVWLVLHGALMVVRAFQLRAALHGGRPAAAKPPLTTT